MSAIYKRELRAYFTTGIGYVFCAVFLAITGFSFSMFTMQYSVGGNKMDLPMYFLIVILAMVVLLPLLTMKSFSEDKKLKTEQLILTSPISLTAMVCAKFFAAYTVFAGTLTVTSVYFLVISKFGEPTYSIIFGYFIGILLLGAAFTAVGIFISSLTENQLIAAVGTIAVLMIMIAASMLNSFIDSAVIRTVLSWISVYSRFSNFTYGLFDFAALAYYFSICFAFLFLTVRVYEKRRWE
ncbi:MAG: ABC transporter [Ruminococcaceae bacterium]|nr:ABC transporter [Oscillospiraceae bacterium]